MNDGTAIVVFNVFLTLAKGEEKSFGSIMKDLITQPILSVVVGIVFGQVCMYWIQHSRRDHLADITITLFAAYIAFMLAETVLKMQRCAHGGRARMVSQRQGSNIL